MTTFVAQRTSRSLQKESCRLGFQLRQLKKSRARPPAVVTASLARAVEAMQRASTPAARLADLQPGADKAAAGESPAAETVPEFASSAGDSAVTCAVLPADWMEIPLLEGGSYFWHSVTNEVTCERPGQPKPVHAATAGETQPKVAKTNTSTVKTPPLKKEHNEEVINANDEENYTKTRKLKVNLSDASTSACSTAELRAKATRRRPTSARTLTQEPVQRKAYWDSLLRSGSGTTFWLNTLLTMKDKLSALSWRNGCRELLQAACKDLKFPELFKDATTQAYKSTITDLLLENKIDEAEIFLRSFHLDLVPKLNSGFSPLHSVDHECLLKSYKDIDFRPLGFDANIDNTEDILEATREYCGFDEERFMHFFYSQGQGRNPDLWGFHKPYDSDDDYP
eukprot:TRINITY_DN43413_c0_g1_i1.p1 TRINITY_DN43413_c0_g1~~TRINITY_DN43413_c0_g1_i1.p1  ORF type:complete len:396 (+),score=103.05 TRINITY_DN43413_c0_g1_i1:280-1467(+)